MLNFNRKKYFLIIFVVFILINYKLFYNIYFILFRLMNQNILKKKKINQDFINLSDDSIPQILITAEEVLKNI